MVKKSLKELRLRIADIVIQVTSNGHEMETYIEDGYNQFITTDNGEPDLILYTHYADIPTYQFEEEIFNSGGVWKLYRSEGKYIMKLFSPLFGSLPYKLVSLDTDFKSGDLYIRSLMNSQEHCSFVLEYPLDEVLMINLLSLCRGVEFHACGVYDDGKGTLFLGSSGAGKSTMANLWKDKKEAKVLSDDRIIIRKINGGFFMYGTPWHGNARFASPEGVPLEKIFFLKHAKNNTISLKKGADAISTLFVRSFPTFWNKKGIQYILQLLSELSEKIPCYELGFVPDESIIEFIRNKPANE